MITPLLSVILLLAVLGLIIYFVMGLPIPELFKRAIYVIVAVIVLIYLASIFGVHFPK